ncbi:MAG TPA: hypothetical protein VIY52_22115 [Streptosporangiaceae bacterium]
MRTKLTGRARPGVKWEYTVNVPEKSGPGPDGVAVADGAVYEDTSTSVFALSAATGKTIWVDSSLLNSGQGAFEIQPQVADGRVYVAWTTTCRRRRSRRPSAGFP